MTLLDPPQYLGSIYLRLIHDFSISGMNGQRVLSICIYKLTRMSVKSLRLLTPTIKKCRVIPSLSMVVAHMVRTMAVCPSLYSPFMLFDVSAEIIPLIPMPMLTPNTPLESKGFTVNELETPDPIYRSSGSEKYGGSLASSLTQFF
jgi:hypothetical protein